MTVHEHPSMTDPGCVPKPPMEMRKCHCASGSPGSETDFPAAKFTFLVVALADATTVSRAAQSVLAVDLPVRLTVAPHASGVVKGPMSIAIPSLTTLVVEPVPVTQTPFR